MEFDYEKVDFLEALPLLFRELGGMPCRINGELQIVAWTCQNCDLRRLLELKQPCEFTLHDDDCEKHFMAKFFPYEQGSRGQGVFLSNLAERLRR